jgi:diaminopimelate epimerase
MCGNGARCAARFAYLTGIVKKTEMSFRTLAGIIKAEMLAGRVKVQMTAPHDLELGIQVEADGQPFDLDFVNTGVPHITSFVADEQELESVDVLRWGRALRFHPRFQPAGTNVNFVLLQGPQCIGVRTYERGVEGETLACGTGAIASSLIAAAKGSVSSPVKVTTRGGESLTIHFHRPPFRKSATAMDFEEVYLEGEARVVYEADLWDETIVK